MFALWSHANDVSYMGPQGDILVGWKNVQQGWTQQAALKMGGSIEPKEMHVIVNPVIGISNCYEVGTNQLGNKTQTVKIRASNIFRKEGGKWKMISHQTDLLPYLQKP